MSKLYVIYHKNCPDGFGAALVLHEYFVTEQNMPVHFIPAGHGDALPDCDGSDVYLVDFSYPRKVMEELAKRAKQVTVIDHHISAEEDLEGLDKAFGNVDLHFDQHHSGAVLSWKFFYQRPVPKLLLYIQDRDLWQFQYPDTEYIIAALMSLPFDFTLWQRYLLLEQALQELLVDGKAIMRYRKIQIAMYVKQARIIEFCGYKVPVVNCPSNLASDVLHELAKDYPFAVSYQDKAYKRAWALRSTKDGIDVSKIAKQYGGGGHFHASGFRTEWKSPI